MVRRVGARSVSLKAALAVLFASGVLLCHLLACTESPMTFSPDGKSLAFVTMEPYVEVEAHLAGPSDYRLMVVDNQKDLHLVEETSDTMLTAPGYSPDGKQLCYLRLPLPSKLQFEQMADASTQARERWGKVRQPPATEPVSSPVAVQTPSQPVTSASWNFKEVALPHLEKMEEMTLQLLTSAPMKAELVIRQARDRSLIRTIPIELRGLGVKASGGLDSFFMAYVTMRPQYSPDGQWIYLCVGDVLLAVNPEQMVQHVLAAPATSAALSPDGKTIAFLQEPAICFVRTDASQATYVRWDGAPSLSGLVWVDNAKLAVLSKGAPPASRKWGTPPTSVPSDSMTITFMRTDGTVLPSPAVSFAIKEEDEKRGELAVSRDGKYIVVAFPQKVYFLNGGGWLIGQIDLENKSTSQPRPGRLLVQPTFAPDSRSVALKSIIADNGAMRTEAIVFFSPEGKEISRVGIPPIKAWATRPAEEASQPASQPSE